MAEAAHVRSEAEAEPRVRRTTTSEGLLGELAVRGQTQSHSLARIEIVPTCAVAHRPAARYGINYGLYNTGV